MAETEMPLSPKEAFSAASAALTARTEIVSKLLDEVGGFEAFNQHFKGVGVYKELTPPVAQLYIATGVTAKENLYSFIRDNHANKELVDQMKDYLEAEEQWNSVLAKLDVQLNERLFGKIVELDALYGINIGGATLTDCQSLSDRKLSDCLEKPLTVVILVRFYGCPYCVQHVVGVHEKYPELDKLNCSILVICKSTAEGGVKWCKRLGINMRLLADQRGQIINELQFTTSTLENDGMGVIHWAANIVSEGNTLEYATFVDDPVQNINQLGGTMIVDKQGKLLYLHKSKQIHDRLSPDAVVQQVVRLNASLNDHQETETEQIDQHSHTQCKCSVQ